MAKVVAQLEVFSLASRMRGVRRTGPGRKGERGEGHMDVVGVDVGATKIAAEVVSPAGEILSEADLPVATYRAGNLPH